MRGRNLVRCAAVALGLAGAAAAQDAAFRQMARDGLADKIRGGWAGQMAGVSHAALTEFEAQGEIIEGEYEKDGIENAIGQDDLYVEMTFAAVMDSVGLDATCEQYGAAFKESKYRLWHANAGARRLLNLGVPAPLSGHPAYNIHADDIDFQIEADFIGLMCPGLPQESNRFCDRVGHVMNHGDGVYGGMFVCGMYAAAYFESDVRAVVEAGLACIPAESQYAQIIGDVLEWSGNEPDDWRNVWHKIEAKWNKDDPCPDGALQPFNIDAKLNGAYIAMGLLYGQGDWEKTLEVSTRCGQDSDCNASSAAGVLGTMIGYRNLPAATRAAINGIADEKFDFTEYSFNEIVASTERRAHLLIERAGGAVGEKTVSVPVQPPKAAALEQCHFGVPAAVVPIGDSTWSWKGGWKVRKQAALATDAQCEASLSFKGTGIALAGKLDGAGGQAEVYLDGVKAERPADAYAAPNTTDNDLWHVHGLPDGEHTVRLVTTGQKQPQSGGTRIALQKAVVYQAK